MSFLMWGTLYLLGADTFWNMGAFWKEVTKSNNYLYGNLFFLNRNTPTSAGPNSFNKGSKGFTDHRNAMEKSFKLEHPSRSKEVKE